MQFNHNIDALLAEARKAHQNGNLQAALSHYEKILECEPNHDDAIAMSGIIYCQNGQIDAGIQQLENAIAINPNHFDAHLNLTIGLEAVGRIDDAIKTCQRTIKLKPEFLDAHHLLAQLFDRQGNAQDAEQTMLSTLLASPENAELFYALIQRQIKNGHISDALETCEKFYNAYPNNMRAMAFMAFVQNELGNEKSARELLDFDRFIQCIKVDNVPGYESTSALNAELTTFILDQPSLMFEPENKSTRSGLQTASLQSETAKPFNALRQVIERNISAYIDQRSSQTDHPFLTSIPSYFSLDIWATALSPSGHQKSHFHPGGWLSGVYYPALPASMLNDETSTAGHIEFGRPQDMYGFKATPLIHTIRPEEGLMVLFPSYFYHCTIPTADAKTKKDEQRFSIAFDAVPQT